MAKDEQKLEHGSIEDYILLLIKEKEKEFSEIKDNTSPMFSRIGGQVDILYIVMTGWNNPQSNPKK